VNAIVVKTGRQKQGRGRNHKLGEGGTPGKYTYRMRRKKTPQGPGSRQEKDKYSKARGKEKVGDREEKDREIEKK
jgi:hypothetical protein